MRVGACTRPAKLCFEGADRTSPLNGYCVECAAVRNQHAPYPLPGRFKWSLVLGEMQCTCRNSSWERDRCCNNSTEKWRS